MQVLLSRYRHPFRRWLLVLLIVLGSAAAVSAREILQDSKCVVPADTTVDGTLIVLCDSLRIEGTVNGDVFGVGLRTTITGRINGSVYLAGFTLRHEGTIANSLHYLGLTLAIKGLDGSALPAVGGNALVAALRADLEKNAQIVGSLFTAAYQWNVDGIINGELNYWGSRLEINGIVRSPVYASVGDPGADGSQIRSLLLPFGFDVTLSPPGLVIGPTGLLVDQLEYTGPVQGVIDGTTLSSVQFRRNTPNVPMLTQPSTFVIYGGEVLREFTALLVLGVIGWLLVPRVWQRPMITLRLRPIPSFSFGMLAFILSFPLIFMLGLMTILLVIVLLIVRLDGVAAALGLLLTIATVSLGGTFYFVAIYVSRVLFGWAIGRFMLRSARADMSVRVYSISSLMAGMLTLAVLVSLPTVGWIFNALALFLGLGAALLVLIEYLQQVRGVVPQPPSTPYARSALRVAIPNGPMLPTMSESLRTATPSLPFGKPDLPGMENLPPGFDPDRFFND